jgi:hypothetical protein
MLPVHASFDVVDVGMFRQFYTGAVTRIKSNPLPCSFLQ